MRPALSIAALLALAGCPWDPPVTSNPLAAPDLLNAVQGTVVFAGNTAPSDTFVTVYSADNPGPPEGTGRPMTFSAIGARQYTGDSSSGLQSAPYSVTQLPDGAYLFNALVDRDGDFSALAGPLAGATCGDWVGRHVTDLVSLQGATVAVAGGKVVDDVTVFIGQEMITERPAFEFVGGAPELSKATAVGAIPPVYRVRATGIHTAFGEAVPLTLADACEPEADLPVGGCDSAAACPCEIDGMPACAGAFYVWLVDDDGDGEVDPYPADLQAAAGLKNVWPRVFLESLDENLGMFEHEGKELPERWVAESFPLAAEIGIAELTGGTAADVAPIGVPFPALELNITLSPVFRHYHADGTAGADANGPFDLLDLREPEANPDLVPEGGWGATLISFTGQTWNLPNEIGLVPLSSTDPGFDVVTQAAVIQLGP